MTPDEKSPAPPIASPIAPATTPSDRRASWPLLALQESTPSPLSGSDGGRVEASNNRAGTLGLKRLRDMVNERDLAILTSVAAHRLLLSSHLYALHFWNHASWASGIRACNRVLNRLREHRLLRRLERPVGGHGGGSQSYVWAIDVAGERLLRHLDPEERGRQRPFEPSTTFLAHTLAIADRRIEVEHAARSGAFDLVSVTTEPSTWRQFAGQHGQTVWLKPDLALTTALGEWEHDWFIEQDLGTESGSALLRKCRVYQQYFDSGREQRARGAFPRVLWLMPDQRRVDHLERLLAAEKGITPGLFTVTLSSHLVVRLIGEPSTSPSESKTNPTQARLEKGGHQ